jgi:hypothetical protein
VIRGARGTFSILYPVLNNVDVMAYKFGKCLG